MHQLTRIGQLQKTLTDPRSAYFVSNPQHIQYLTGCVALTSEREAFVLCSKNTCVLLQAPLSPPTINPEHTNTTFFAQTLGVKIAELVSSMDIDVIFFDDVNLTVAEHARIVAENPRCLLQPLTENPLSQLMTVKDATERSFLRKSCSITHEVYKAVVKNLTVGITDQAVVNQIYQEYAARGVQRLAFPPIVAFGAHSAHPHHQPTDQKLTLETPVLIDLGGTHAGYCSDMTRTTWFGSKPSKLFLEVEAVVLAAYQKGKMVLDHLYRPEPTTVLAKDVDTATRDHITQAGFDQYFTHSSGHGLGLAIHEAPSLHLRNAAPLQKYMALTIEPGIYLPEQFGYRHENTIVLEDTGVIEL